MHDGLAFDGCRSTRIPIVPAALNYLGPGPLFDSVPESNRSILARLVAGELPAAEKPL